MGLEAPPDLKKANTAMPELQSLAASPRGKEMPKAGSNEVPKTSQSEIALSKVQMLRHLLFTSLKSSIVSIEQSSCLQSLPFLVLS